MYVGIAIARVQDRAIPFDIPAESKLLLFWFSAFVKKPKVSEKVINKKTT